MNMKNHSALRGTTLLVAIMLATSVTAFAQQPKGGEQFTANLVDPTGTFGRHHANTAPVVIHIDHYTSDVEAGQLRDILQKKGPEALRDALWDEEAGYIRVGGGLGYPIAAARSVASDGGRIIRLMIDRPISQREVILNTHTLDYPFAYVEIKLDASGKGQGDFYQAAKVSLKNDNTLHIDNFSPQPLRLLGVKAR